MIWLQAICFGSYLAANILLFIEIGIFSSNQNGSPTAILIIYIISLTLSFVTQTTMIMIFLEIGKRNPLRSRNSEVFDKSPRVLTEENRDETIMFTAEEEPDIDKYTK